ncbi:MAG: phosphonate ABC transporter, permease protein PhnE [Hyphomonadaceae bacterium]
MITPAPPNKPLTSYAFDILVWGGLALALLASFGPAEVWKVPDLIGGAGNIADLAAGFAKPDFTRAGRYVADMGLTLAIAIWGTALAVMIGAPLSLLCANNVAPFWVVRPFRLVADVLRSINEFVFAMLFVVAVGLGPIAGLLAVTASTTGIVAKLFSEAVEATDPRPVEGVRAVGASRLQEIFYGVLPQVAPLWTSLALYRFESNVRAATVLGIVGAGGIGQTLYENIRGFRYAESAAVVLIIIAAVWLTDGLSSFIRKRMI